MGSWVMSKLPMDAVQRTGISDDNDKSNIKEDLTGRDRMAWNVLASWAGHMVFVIAGFVMPRMIDRHIGQTSLGIWDFSWSLVSYFGLAGLGIGSSVNRYVAKYRAVNDIDGLRRAVSSVWCIQVVVSFVIVLATAVVASFIPLWFKERLGAEMKIAQWVVVLLGLSLAVEMAFDAFRGVMTGCHRWDFHNGLNA
jgi:O-antigen/teichoic acid export membrane protein